jgi:hypothetical protein
MSYDTLLVEQRERVLLVTLNRPEALNALNSQLLSELLDVTAAFDQDPGLGCAVITGSAKAFAAGADIKEMSAQGFADMYGQDFFAGWDRFTRTRKPMIAAVAGYALGGGCELAMMCDFILAADTAKFGQPEIKLGVSPGMGGSQRLARAVGKAKAMEMVRPRRSEPDWSAASCPRASWSRKQWRPQRRLPAWRPWRRRLTRKWSTPRMKAGCPRGCSSSGACSTHCSARRTKRKVWRRSSRSGRGTGRGGSRWTAMASLFALWPLLLAWPH